MKDLPSSGQARLESWTPAAAIGLTCTDCHPEYRGTASEVWPDNGSETVGSGTLRIAAVPPSPVMRGRIVGAGRGLEGVDRELL
ncbi:hypothetical protein [Streptomyces sp. NWU339]|uniref:hypothetical protein n=1 Tax=Streptomyces sp. NWU339 TaxID=2185284 RepID=UPI0011B5628F|nr:hypothetical protein [Streptomyces sp. NWU339]